MNIDDIAGNPDFPRKLLDKKTFVRIDPDTGDPQLIRMEPDVKDGELSFETVVVTIDNATPIIMRREMANAFIESNGCVPLEGFSDWKSKDPN